MTHTIKDNAVISSDGSVIKHFPDVEKAAAFLHYINGGDGLTLLERFAIAALQGVEAANIETGTQSLGSVDDVADRAWAIAEAMMEARKI